MWVLNGSYVISWLLLLALFFSVCLLPSSSVVIWIMLPGANKWMDGWIDGYPVICIHKWTLKTAADYHFVWHIPDPSLGWQMHTSRAFTDVYTIQALMEQMFRGKSWEKYLANLRRRIRPIWSKFSTSRSLLNVDLTKAEKRHAMTLSK